MDQHQQHNQSPVQPAPVAPVAPAGPAPAVATLQRASGTAGSIMPFATAAFILSLLVLAALVVQLTLVNSREQEMTELLAEQEAAYQRLQPVAKEVENLNLLVEGLKVAYAAQLPFGQLLATLAAASYNAVVYQGVSINSTGTVQLSGYVSQYSDFARLVKALRTDDDSDQIAGLTSEVNIGSVGQAMVSVGEDENSPKERRTSFVVSFTVDKSLFSAQSATQP